MLTRARLAVLAVVVPVLAGCPSKEGGRSDAQAPGAGATAPPPATGPLANLESSPSAVETWSNEANQPVPLVYFAQENLRLSAQCKQPNGQLACDAIQYLRHGTPVEISRRFLDGRQSPGVKACMRLKQPVVVVHNSVGAEDSLCQFPDGSFVTTGGLERYGMRVTE